MKDVLAVACVWLDCCLGGTTIGGRMCLCVLRKSAMLSAFRPCVWLQQLVVYCHKPASPCLLQQACQRLITNLVGSGMDGATAAAEELHPAYVSCQDPNPSPV